MKQNELTPLFLVFFVAQERSRSSACAAHAISAAAAQPRYKQRFCQACGLASTRADARYCSARCRQRAHRSAAKKAADGETPRMTAHEA
jgi:hypothetical protein